MFLLNFLSQRLPFGTFAVLLLVIFLPLASQAQAVDLEEIESWVEKNITAQNPHLDVLIDTLTLMSKHENIEPFSSS